MGNDATVRNTVRRSQTLGSTIAYPDVHYVTTSLREGPQTSVCHAGCAVIAGCSGKHQCGISTIRPYATRRSHSYNDWRPLSPSKSPAGRVLCLLLKIDLVPCIEKRGGAKRQVRRHAVMPPFVHRERPWQPRVRHITSTVTPMTENLHARPFTREIIQILRKGENVETPSEHRGGIVEILIDQITLQSDVSTLGHHGSCIC